MMLDQRLEKRITEKKRLLDSLRPLSPSILQKLREQVLVEWTYNSNAIEGNTLTLEETKLVLEEGVTIGGKSIREHFEAINHKEAIEFIETMVDKGEAVTAHVIRQLHALILKGIDDEQAGKYRTTQVRIGGTKYVPPDPSQVLALMGDFDHWLQGGLKKLSPIEYAALAHFKLVNIHPFVDGNGRTARLLMNLILMREGFPPSVILKADRKIYYSALQKADGGEVVPFVNFVGRSVDRALSLWLSAAQPAATPEQADKSKFISLSEAAKLTPYSPKYLNLLARTGKLGAFKLGRNWVTTKKAIEDYLKSLK